MLEQADQKIKFFLFSLCAVGMTQSVSLKHLSVCFLFYFLPFLLCKSAKLGKVIKNGTLANQEKISLERSLE